MADLLGDEPLGVAELDQVGDVGVPQAVQRQLRRQPGLLGAGTRTGGRSSSPTRAVDVRSATAPAAAPGRSSGRACSTHCRRPSMTQSNSGTASTVRRRGDAAAAGLGVADMHRPVGAPGRHRRVRPQVGDIEEAQLAAAQPERVGRLDHLRVPQRRQRALAARAGDPLDPVVEVVEQRLQLVVGERPPPGPALVLDQVRGGVEVVADLRRDRPEPVLALVDPAVAAVQQVVAEQPQRQVVAPDRRGRQPARPASSGDT